MRSWIKSKFGVPRPARSPKVIWRLSTDDGNSVLREGVSNVGEIWRFESRGDRTFRLLEVRDPRIEKSFVTFCAEIRSEGVKNCAFFEMWCRYPREGEFFSTGIHNLLEGESDWQTFEINLRVSGPESPDLIRVNLIFDGPGTVELR